MSIQEMVAMFNLKYLFHRINGDKKSDYYCGITKDIQQREKDHNTQFLYYVEMSNGDEAKRLEAALHDEGYDTGKQLGNGDNDSIYVYIYRKSICTVE